MLTTLLDELRPHGAQLIAVSKTKPNEAIMALYEQGQRAFGENRVQELCDKQATLPADIQWHAIGHLQTNKVKAIVPFVHLIHSVDSERLLREIDKQAALCDRVVDCLLQFKIAQEDTKYGFDLGTAQEMLSSSAFASLAHVRICGVMGMATFTDDEVQVRREFMALKHIFDTLQQDFFAAAPSFKECSMGMSGDYPIALACGSTMVRIGSLLFGER